jgi:hypothetical protein
MTATATRCLISNSLSNCFWFFIDMTVRSGGCQLKTALNVVLISGFIIVGCVVLGILLVVRPGIETNPEVRR